MVQTNLSPFPGNQRFLLPAASNSSCTSTMLLQDSSSDEPMDDGSNRSKQKRGHALQTRSTEPMCDVCGLEEAQARTNTYHGWRFGPKCWSGLRTLLRLYDGEHRFRLQKQMDEEAHLFKEDCIECAPGNVNAEKTRSRIKRKFEDVQWFKQTYSLKCGIQVNQRLLSDRVSLFGDFEFVENNVPIYVFRSFPTRLPQIHVFVISNLFYQGGPGGCFLPFVNKHGRLASSFADFWVFSSKV